MRIITGGMVHETSTFTSVATAWESYRERPFGFLRGDDILSTFRGTNSMIGGYLEGADKHGFELIPTVYANAHPSGPTPRDIFDAILGEMLDGIRASGEIDGVLLELHGSMVAEGIDDCEGHILTAVREVVGPQIPILAELDIHSNVSHRMVEVADVLIGRETNPEVDAAERARECADVLIHMLRDGLRPTMALHQIPMIWGVKQVTAQSPMREAIEELHRIEAQPGVICGSIATGYHLADHPDVGPSVNIVTDNDPGLARKYADELGEWLLQRRADWHAPKAPSTRGALAQAEADRRFPVIFADWNDNTGAGTPGDSTGMLRTFLEAGLESACVLYMVDQEAIARCREAGVGATLTLEVGGKSSTVQGEPVQMTAEVVALSDGRFVYDGPMNAGLEGSMGPSAYIRQGGVHVLLVTQREQPFDMAFSRSVSLDPRRMRYIGLKSGAHFRAVFESWAGAVHIVSERSVHKPAAGSLQYHRLGPKLYLFDDV